MTFDIRTECAHCGRPIRLQIDAAMNYRLVKAGSEEQIPAEPLVFSPHVDWTSFEEPNIIHAY